MLNQWYYNKVQKLVLHRYLLNVSFGLCGLIDLIVVPQLSSGQRHNDSNQTRQAGLANDQSMYSFMSMTLSYYQLKEVYFLNLGSIL